MKNLLINQEPDNGSVSGKLNIVSALFSAKASVAVTILCTCAIWWHNISIPDVAAAQRAVAIDGLCAMPWGIAWVIKSLRQPMKEEGGEL